MAMFGLPGGSEWLVIVAVIVLLFVPGIVVFSAGFLMGRKAGEREAAEDVSPGEPEAEEAEPGVLQPSRDEGATGGDDDA